MKLTIKKLELVVYDGLFCITLTLNVNLFHNIVIIVNINYKT